ncbi:hypothetical protein LBMAG52_05300 [Planctomycetia bacterium]|nr:hypothetical protein LBMAG52_05300 [Planctomycetia bacterium]
MEFCQFEGGHRWGSLDDDGQQAFDTFVLNAEQALLQHPFRCLCIRRPEQQRCVAFPNELVELPLPPVAWIEIQQILAEGFA